MMGLFVCTGRRPAERRPLLSTADQATLTGNGPGSLFCFQLNSPTLYFTFSFFLNTLSLSHPLVCVEMKCWLPLMKSNI